MTEINQPSATFAGVTGENTSLAPTDVLVIAHIDDIGMVPDTAESAIEVMKHGMAKSGSLMVPAPGFERAVQVFKAHPDLDFGIHITLTNEWQEIVPWKPLLSKDEVPSLYNENGLMWPNEYFFAYHAMADDVAKEMEEQILAALKTGIRLSHMDAHMGCFFMRQDFFDAALTLAEKYHLSIVSPYPFYPWFTKSDLMHLKEQGYKCPDTFYGFYQDSSMALKTYQDYLAGLSPGIHYLFIHPIGSTPETRQLMPDLAIRSRDYDIWTGNEMKEFTTEKKIRFISFSEF